MSKKVTPRSAFAAAFAIFVVLALVNAAVSSPPAAATRSAAHATTRVRLEHVLAPFTSLTPARPVCPLQILRLFTQRAFRLVRRRRRALVVPPGRREDPTKRRRRANNQRFRRRAEIRVGSIRGDGVERVAVRHLRGVARRVRIYAAFENINLVRSRAPLRRSRRVVDVVVRVRVAVRARERVARNPRDHGRETRRELGVVLFRRV